MEYIEYDAVDEAAANATAAANTTTDDYADQLPGRWFFDGTYYDLTQLTSVYVILILLSVVVMMVGLTGNSMVIAVVFRHRAMRTPTNYYIVSLALSDFLVTSFVMPLKLLELSADVDISFLNAAMCSVLGFVQPYFVFTSIWTLVAISIDRYLVIIHPLRSRSFNTRARASRNVATIWLVPFLVLAGYFYPHKTLSYRMSSELGVIRRTACMSGLPHAFQQWYTLLQFTVLLLVPVALLCFTCFSIARRLFRLTEDEKMLKTSLRKEEASRRKVAKMVLVVVFAFVMCWAPFFVVTLFNHFLKFLMHKNFFFWQCVLYLLGFSNSCMNPIIYAFMSRAFRRGFRGIIVCVCPCAKPCFKDKGTFANPRRSVTIISSEPATEACRVGGGEAGRAAAKKRRLAGAQERASRWNNTQYSTMTETEGIEMAKMPPSSVNGGPNASPSKADASVERSPATDESQRLVEDQNKIIDGRNAQETGGTNRRSFTKIEEESPFEEVTLEDGLPTDHNRNTPLYSAKQDFLHHDAEGEEPGCTAPLLKEEEDNSANENAE